MPKLHIIAFDIPYPADYGGVIDIYHKTKALSELGIDVTLHMFHYGRKHEKARLKKVAKHLYYYKRKTYKNPFIGNIPYIVNSRSSEELLKNLLKDNAPILFEGLHTTFHLKHPALAKRFKVVRTHNVEHHYYKNLEQSELRYFKKYFFRIEAEKLAKYEKVLKLADTVAAISAKDTVHFLKRNENTHHIPAFHSNEDVTNPGKRGKFVLYHGNLAVPENYLAAMQLAKNVFRYSSLPAIIAGNNPPKELITLCDSIPNVEIQTNLNTNSIHKLIVQAHINVLFTNQSTGIKLKLLNALYRGKFAVVNSLMVKGTNLEGLCHVKDDFKEILSQVEELSLVNYSQDDFEKRKDYLNQHFSNRSSAEQLISIIDFKESKELIKVRKSGVLNSLSHISSILSYFAM